MAKSNGDGMRMGNAFSGGNAFSMLAQSVTTSPPPKSNNSPKVKTRADKYNIKDGEATLTPTQFDEAFACSGKIGLLRKEGVKKINISSSNVVNMVFEIFETTTPASEWQDAPYIHSQDIITFGVVQAAASNQKVIIHNDREIAGFLRVHQTAPDLAKLGAKRNEDSRFTDNRGKIGIINATSVFKDDESITKALSHLKTSGGLRLFHIFETASGTSQAVEIGKLVGMDSLKKHRVDPSNLRRISTHDIMTALPSTKARTPNQLMIEVFKDARGECALYSSEDFNPFPVAVFVPPKKTLG